jgi:endogenous inhibitor of DNA gyrase (YacG/DUF329 family)
MTEPVYVKCPGCGVDVEWGERSPQRPFCSERCRNKDFIGWAKEEHRIGGDPNYDDLLSDDLPER